MEFLFLSWRVDKRGTVVSGLANYCSAFVDTYAVEEENVL